MSHDWSWFWVEKNVEIEKVLVAFFTALYLWNFVFECSKLFFEVFYSFWQLFAASKLNFTLEFFSSELLTKLHQNKLQTTFFSLLVTTKTIQSNFPLINVAKTFTNLCKENNQPSDKVFFSLHSSCESCGDLLRHLCMRYVCNRWEWSEFKSWQENCVAI